MKKLNSIIAIILSFALIFTFSSCSLKTDNKTSYSITDSKGKEISFEKVPERVISILPAATEIIYALNQDNKLIAVSELCNYPEDTANKTKLGTGMNINIESIVGLNPDVVFVGKMDLVEDQYNQMEQAGIKVVTTHAESIEDTYNIIEIIGSVLKVEDTAGKIINDMKKEFDEIKKQVEGKESKKVYFEISPLMYNLWTCGQDTFQHELLTLVGAQNIFDDIKGWKEISQEQVLSRNPDIIITTSGPEIGIEDPIKEIMSRDGWTSISAVKNNRVYTVNPDTTQRPTPRLVDAAKELVNIIYE